MSFTLTLRLWIALYAFSPPSCSTFVRCAHIKYTVSDWSKPTIKPTTIDTDLCNAVMYMWGSLRLTPIIISTFRTSRYSCWQAHICTLTKRDDYDYEDLILSLSIYDCIGIVWSRRGWAWLLVRIECSWAGHLGKFDLELVTLFFIVSQCFTAVWYVAICSETIVQYTSKDKNLVGALGMWESLSWFVDTHSVSLQYWGVNS